VAEEKVTRKLTTILAADVEGYTRLMRADEEATLKTLGEYREIINGLIARHEGRVFSTGGDSVLAEFGSAVEAVRCAISCQEEISSRNAELADDRKLMFRIGINVGDVMVRDGDLFGDGVNVAARLEGLAEAGGVCISGSVFEQIKHKLSLGFEDMGLQEIKNIAEPVSAYRLVPGQVSVSADATAATKPSDGKNWRMPAIAVVVAVLVAMVGAALWWQPWAPEFEPASVERMAFPLPGKPSIAVLPFDNLTGDTEQEYFADGITNDIITDLSKFSRLFVIASHSTFTYKGKPVKVQQVAEDLGVRYVLEGSVQRSGDQIRINAQLIDATSGRHLWAERYERDTEELFAVQTEIIETIVATLAFRVDEVERERVLHKDTENLAAYDYFLLGDKKFLVFTKEAMTEARTLLEKAIELDPNYAHAYAQLAFVHSYLHMYNWTEDTDRSLEIALEMARKAVALNPDDYYNHWILGRAYKNNRDFDRGMAGYERALELNPNDASLLAEMVNILVQIGRAEDGVAQSKLAMRINPHYPDWYLWNLGWAQYFTGEYEEALASLKRMSNPPNGVRRTLAAVLVRLGRDEEARAVIAAFREQEPDFTVATMENFAFQNRAYLERWMADLRTAGLPD